MLGLFGGLKCEAMHLKPSTIQVRFPALLYTFFTLQNPCNSSHLQNFQHDNHPRAHRLLCPPYTPYLLPLSLICSVPGQLSYLTPWSLLPPHEFRDLKKAPLMDMKGEAEWGCTLRTRVFTT